MGTFSATGKPFEPLNNDTYRMSFWFSLLNADPGDLRVAWIRGGGRTAAVEPQCCRAIDGGSTRTPWVQKAAGRVSAEGQPEALDETLHG